MRIFIHPSTHPSTYPSLSFTLAHTHACCFVNHTEQRLKSKVPELEKSLNLVGTLIKKREDGAKGIVRYSLADNIYAKAEVDYTEDKVNLWLGANVMLEYTYDEAHEFLSKKMTLASTELEETNTDLAFVRDQIVTSEVNMSRIFNWDVRRKRAETKTVDKK
jgi:prefoldin subunit 5